MEVLLTHLIKQAIEKRTTKSWDVSIRNAVRQIRRINKRRKTGGWYLTHEALLTALEEAYESALDTASLEVLEGKYTATELDSLIERAVILRQALGQILHA
jgi:hypothetical protein